MGFWKRTKPVVEMAEHLHFGDTVLSHLFDYRHWLWSLVPGGGIMTWLWAAIDGRSALEVWLMAIVAAAAIAVVVLAAIKIIERRRLTAVVSGSGSNEVGSGISAIEPTADIDARAAFFQILENSAWSENRLKTTTDTKNLRYDWLERALDEEIHKALRNSRLAAWGKESLPGTATTPEKPIPPTTWDKVDINFERNSSWTTAAYLKGLTSLQLGSMAWVGVKFSKDQVFGSFPLTSAKSSSERIPITELLKMAKDRGWSFTDQHVLQLIDLQDAIRQGGLDGHLTVWGKLNRWPRAEQLMRKEVIEKIPAYHWREFRVHLIPVLDEDNFGTKSWHVSPSSTAELGYIDLHVTRSEAAIWLDRDALAFRGKTTPEKRGP
jgi:hypothetical protein